jgi:hypothetical protein
MKTATFALSLSLLSAACSMPPENGESSLQVEETNQAVLAGDVVTTNSFNAAVYHFVNAFSCNPPTIEPAGWFIRPCSGTVLKRTQTETLILTARHCVTVDGSTLGQLVPATGFLKVSTELNPGPVLPGGSPPASAQPATLLYAGSSAGPEEDVDIAILRVDSRLSLQKPVRMELFRGTAAELAAFGKKDDFGYGRSMAGACDTTSVLGAGQLRSAFGLTLGAISPSHYKFTNDNALGQRVTHGDSGGGAFLPLGPDVKNRVLIGVHFTGGDTADNDVMDTGSLTLAEFIQTRLRGLFLAPTSVAQTTSTDVVGIPKSAAGELLLSNRSGDLSTNKIYYLVQSQRLQVSGFCVNDEGSGNLAKVQLCNSAISSQKWALTRKTIKNVGTGRCLLSGSAGTITTGACGGTAGDWTWLAASNP